MPEINAGESRESYVKRCVPYVVKNEGLTSHQALGKCEGMYDQHLKKAKVHSPKSENKSHG
jgi:hypothetical protein